MTFDWYFSKKGQKEGPFSFEQLRQMARTGSLLPADALQRGGEGTWTAAVDVVGLFDGQHDVPPSLSLDPEPPLVQDSRNTTQPAAAGQRSLASGYWIREDDREVGPCASVYIRARLFAGELNENTPVRTTSSNWTLLGKLDEFQDPGGEQQCPKCGVKLRAPKRTIGKMVKCLDCLARFVVQDGVARIPSERLEGRKEMLAAQRKKEIKEWRELDDTKAKGKSSGVLNWLGTRLMFSLLTVVVAVCLALVRVPAPVIGLATVCSVAVLWWWLRSRQG